MNSAVMLNGKATKPQVSSVKRRLDSIFGSYDQFSEMVGMSGTDDPIIFGRTAVADYPASSLSQRSSRHGAESTMLSRRSNSSWHNHNQLPGSKEGDSSGRRPPSTTDVLQSMQGLVKDKLLTELDCSMNRNCMVKDHSPATTSEATELIDGPTRKRKYSGERQMERILEQFGRVSPLLSPVKRPMTPLASPVVPLPAALSPAVSRAMAKRNSRQRDEDDGIDDRESKLARHYLGSSSSTATAAALVGEPQLLIKPLASMDPKNFGGSSTSAIIVESPVRQRPAAPPIVRQTQPTIPTSLSNKDDYKIDPGHCRLALSTLLSADVCSDLHDKWLRLRRKKTEINSQVAAVPVEEKENTHAADALDSIRPTYSIVIPTSYKSEWTTLSDQVQPVWYESAGELAAILRKPVKFAGQSRVVVQLPNVEDADCADAIISAVERLVRENAPNVADRLDFLLIPPPPRIGADFDHVVDFLLTVRAPHIDANPTFRGRNLYSLGWTGNRLNEVHSRDGRWTRDGLYCIRQFLKGSLRLDWLFKRKPKRAADDAKTRSIAT